MTVKLADLIIQKVIKNKNKKGEEVKKILIIGFRHSGTTMLMQLLRAHPEVGWIEFEESYIEFKKPKEWILKLARKRVPDLKKYAWGEKIPWGFRDDDKNGKRAIRMSKRWLKLFKDGRVLHILRHPLDAVPNGKEEVDHMMASTLEVINFINSNNRCATIVYEDLVMEPEIHLSNIFNFLNLKNNKKIINKVINTKLKFGKINPSRAFAHRKREIKKEVDYNKFLEKLERRL